MEQDPRYQETLDYLYTRLPVFQHVGNSAYNKSLTNILALCKALGEPEEKYGCIHVAGTNGKGSVSCMLSAVFTAHGIKNGLYTSPHLKDFRERIRVDGEMVPQWFVVKFTDRVKPLIDELNPSFFEITVAMAFEWFARQEVKLAVIEVGLGGRLDSTNVIEPLLSIITNIGWDHMDLLGDSLAGIAEEKGGIIKPGIPVLVGEPGVESLPVLERIAAEKISPLLVAAEAEEEYVQACELKGDYQRKNIGTVLSALKMLAEEGYEFDDDIVKQALGNVCKLSGIRGRWEILGMEPLQVADTAHNRDGMERVMEQLNKLPADNLHLVLGVVKEKDLSRILPLMPKHGKYYFAKPNILRGLDAHILQEEAKEFGLKGNVYSSVKEAYESALNAASSKDIVFIGGSTFVVAEVI